MPEFDQFGQIASDGRRWGHQRGHETGILLISQGIGLLFDSRRGYGSN